VKESKPEPKTRGRKPKEIKDTKDFEPKKEVKKDAKKETVKKETKLKKEEKDEDLNQSQISFGKFNITVKKKETNRMIFKDPSEYADMSDEEKKALSKEMMGHYKMLVSNQVKGIKTDA